MEEREREREKRDLPRDMAEKNASYMVMLLYTLQSLFNFNIVHKKTGKFRYNQLIESLYCMLNKFDAILRSNKITDVKNSSLM